MDGANQQNSILAEKNAATAKTLEMQAHAMKERVATFRLNEAGVTGEEPAPWVRVDRVPAHDEAIANIAPPRAAHMRFLDRKALDRTPARPYNPRNESSGRKHVAQENYPM